MASDFRVGQGIDVHPLVEGRRLVIGGVAIEYELGLQGHSDADVLCHALMDALLGAAGKDDIGHFFPSNDERYRDANSLDLLKQVWQMLTAEGWQIGNLDCYVLAEAPKLSKYFPMMRENLCRVLGCQTEQCSIRATTTETLGFVGRREGMLSSAVVLLKR